jgi:hypothetical protein
MDQHLLREAKQNCFTSVQLSPVARGSLLGGGTMLQAAGSSPDEVDFFQFT